MANYDLLRKHARPPTIPGWDAKMDYADEESLYWHNIWIQCDRKDYDLHCHIVSKNDVSMAVKRLKSDKSDVEGRVLSNTYIHGIDHLFMYLSFLFSSMTNHGYAPVTFLQSNMVPISKGARANVTDCTVVLTLVE